MNAPYLWVDPPSESEHRTYCVAWFGVNGEVWCRLLAAKDEVEAASIVRRLETRLPGLVEVRSCGPVSRFDVEAAVTRA